MFGLGISEVVIILVIALIFIGPKKLPELARGLGKGLKEFQNAVRGIQDSIQHSNNHSNHSKDDAASSEKPPFLDQPDAKDINAKKE